MDQAVQGPLSGITVVDLGRVLAAPMATQFLADLGANVIKIERPGAGDDARSYGPACVMDREGRRTRESAFHVGASRNKRSVTVDISKPEGRELVRALAAKADIFVENFIAGVLARYGLDYESLRELNPSLIYCSITGYGQTGPYNTRPGYDAVFQASGGMMQVSGVSEGPTAGPLKTGPSMMDATTGTNAAMAMLIALYHRERTGEGQHIDASLIASSMAVQTKTIQTYLLTGRQPERRGLAGSCATPAGLFACQDGDIYISAGRDDHFAALSRILALPSDERFVSEPGREAHRSEFEALVGQAVKGRRLAELLKALGEAGVPCGPYNDYAAALREPRPADAPLVIDLPHPLAASGEVQVLASPIRLSQTPVRYERAAPLLGQHTDEVLHEVLGLTAEDVAKLRACGAI